MDRNAAILPGYALEDFLTAPEHTGWSADTRDSYRRALQEFFCPTPPAPLRSRAK